MADIYWFVFLAASLLIIITPGQDMVLVMSRSLSQGSLAGIVTAAGVSIGLMGHTVLATLGLGAILQASGALFLILKLVGAAYLIYLGIQLLRSKQTNLGFQQSEQRSLRRLFVQGAFSNLSNPKIALFYFAFLPQFLVGGGEKGATALSLFILGTAFAILTFLVKGPIGFFAGNLSAWIRSHPVVLVWLDRSSCAVLVGLGLKLAFDGRG